MTNQIDKLNYRVVGSGHPIVLLHGFLSSKSMWKFIDLDCFTRIEIDLPGHGKSVGEFTSYSIEYTANLVSDILNELKFDCYDVVGHSLGGYVALELKKNAPNCKNVVLLNSTFWADDADKKIDRDRVAKVVRKNSRLFIMEAIPNLFENPNDYHEVIQGLVREAFGIEPESLAKTSIAMRDRKDNKNVVETNQASFLIIQGETDPIIPPEKMRTALSRLSVQISLVEGCAHMSHIEGAKFVSKQINDFFIKH